MCILQDPGAQMQVLCDVLQEALQRIAMQCLHTTGCYGAVAEMQGNMRVFNTGCNSGITCIAMQCLHNISNISHIITGCSGALAEMQDNMCVLQSAIALCNAIQIRI